ncbi:hypothetical protein BGZ90_002198, partial [Linnemannia elongata]
MNCFKGAFSRTPKPRTTTTEPPPRTTTLNPSPFSPSSSSTLSIPSLPTQTLLQPPPQPSLSRRSSRSTLENVHPPSPAEPSPPTHIQSTTRSTIQALKLPELLSQIFSYLDDQTLIENVTLVCRQWYYFLQGTLPRSVVWDSCSRSQARLNTVPLRLVGAARFFCYLEKESNSNTHDAVIKIFAYSQEQYRKQVETRETGQVVGSGGDDRKSGASEATLTSTTVTTPFRFGPLQELYLTIDDISEQAIHNNFSYPSTLTKLVLKVYYSRFNLVIPFADILRNCPLLEHFEAHETPDLSLLWTPEVVENHQYLYPLALRTFILYNTKIPQASLEALLAATPKLKVLKLIGMSWYNAPYDWTRLLGHLLSLPISLHTVHFSSLTEPMPDGISHRILDACPSALSEWDLWALDISTQLLKELEIYTDRLTTLEVYSQPPAYRLSVGDHCCQSDLKNAPAILHDFLTSPDNENTLLHLRTLKTIARLEDFDIYHREGYILSENLHLETHAQEICAPTGPPPKVWRCQGLRTLHVEMHGPGDCRLENPVHSRIIFGYISLVFPLLEELQVQMPRECILQKESRSYSPRLCLQLEGGLCLLSRLKYLVRLRLVWEGPLLSSRINFEESDMNWMVPSGRKRMFTKKRREEVEAWQRQRVQEDNLGLLSEVEAMIKEIDESKSFIPLSSLKALSLGRHHFAQPASEIKRCCMSNAGAAPVYMSNAGAAPVITFLNERMQCDVLLSIGHFGSRDFVLESILLLSVDPTLKQQFQAAGIEWVDGDSDEPTRYLGYPIVHTPAQLEFFYDKLATKIERAADIHSARQLSVKGRALIANALLLATLWHVARVHPPTTKIIDRINKAIRTFTMPFFPRPSLATAQLTKDRGGLGLLNITHQSTAFQLGSLQHMIKKPESLVTQVLGAVIEKETGAPTWRM